MRATLVDKFFNKTYKILREAVVTGFPEIAIKAIIHLIKLGKKKIYAFQEVKFIIFL
jgi:hypothetical protein